MCTALQEPGPCRSAHTEIAQGSIIVAPLLSHIPEHLVVDDTKM
jgi:hypothetical protein